MAILQNPPFIARIIISNRYPPGNFLNPLIERGHFHWSRGGHLDSLVWVGGLGATVQRMIPPTLYQPPFYVIIFHLTLSIITTKKNSHSSDSEVHIKKIGGGDIVGLVEGETIGGGIYPQMLYNNLTLYNICGHSPQPDPIYH